MVKTISTALWLLALTLVIFSLLLFVVPVATLPGWPGGVRVIEGARVVEGEALLTNPERGSDLLHWRWCPANGPLALCITLTGSSGFAQGLVMPGWGSLAVRDLTISSMPIAVLGLAPQFLTGQIDGQINGLVLHSRGDCLFVDPSQAVGEGALSHLQVMGQAAADHRFVIATPNQQAENASQQTENASQQTESAGELQVSGDAVSGSLTLSPDGRVAGELALQAVTGGETASGTGSTLAVNQILPCAAAHRAGS